jgi:hypothetical protein
MKHFWRLVFQTNKSAANNAGMGVYLDVVLKLHAFSYQLVFMQSAC